LNRKKAKNLFLGKEIDKFRQNDIISNLTNFKIECEQLKKEI